MLSPSKELEYGRCSRSSHEAGAEGSSRKQNVPTAVAPNECATQWRPTPHSLSASQVSHTLRDPTCVSVQVPSDWRQENTPQRPSVSPVHSTQRPRASSQTGVSSKRSQCS